MATWQDEHTHHLLRLIIASSLINRPAFYADPTLAPFAGNGGDKINKRLRQILVSFERANGAHGIVLEEVEKLQKSKRGARAAAKGKKRKISEYEKVDVSE